MNYEREIKLLHKAGFVILQASRTTNAPIGWKRPGAAKGKKKWGYTDEMSDPTLSVYKATFNASLLAKSHCGFYLGHGDLCCIDLDTKKSSTTIEQVTELTQKAIKLLKNKVAVERTKSNGFHIYFRYPERLDNVPDWTGIKMEVDGVYKSNNWIELYYSKRFIACYLSNSKKYTLEHGSVLELDCLTKKEHAKLLSIFAPFRSKEEKPAVNKTKAHEVDQETWDQAENYVSQIEESGLDITGDNPTWFKIGKAFANAFGSKGFDMFNRLSQFSPTYNEDTIEETYSRFVEDDSKDRSKKITIGTFFKMCSDHELLDLTTKQALKLHPSSELKEFELRLSRKERPAEHCHTVVTELLKHVQICCIDSAHFYVFENTHWVKRNARHVIELINSFVDRSDVDDRFRKPLRTVPYLELMLKELRMVTQRDSIEPYTGSLNEGIYINMENGILHIDIKTGKRKLIDHAAEYNFTTVLPFGYDPAARCPKFDKWMETQIPDLASHEAYYAFVASCLTKHKADIIMLLAGDTSTGKSSLIDITRRLIGLENSVAVSAGILFSGTAEAQTQAMLMEHKLLAYDFDAQPFKHLEMLLKVAAQEPIPGWQMHVTRRPVVNYGRLIIAMNPYNYSVFNSAVARRFVTINMDVPVVKDNSVMPAIYENELAGIFNKVLNVGIKHLIDNNGQIKITEKIKKATLNFHMKSRDAVRWFDQHYLVPVPHNDKSPKATAEMKVKAANPDMEIIFTDISTLYQQFRIWLEDTEGYPASKIPLRKHFASDMKMYGVEDLKTVIGKGTYKYGVYIGIKK